MVATVVGDGGATRRRAEARVAELVPRLRLLEPLACLALAGHAVAVQVVATDAVASVYLVAAVLLAVAATAGLLGWRDLSAVTVRVALVIALGFVLMALRVDGSGYILLWYFVVVAVYPGALPRRAGLVVAVIVPLVYLGLVPLDAADGPLPVAAMRAVALALIAVFVNLTAAAFREAVAERDDALATLRTFADATPAGLGFWDTDLRFRWLNATLADISGLAVADHLGRRVGEVPGVPEPFLVQLERVRSTGRPVDGVEIAEGDRIWRTSCFPVGSAEGVIGIGAVIIDVTAEREAARALSHSATHDALTGLPNRDLFSDRVEVALAEASRGDEHVAVVLCDLDRFNLLNESLGHAAGDDLLVAASARLTGVVRTGDTVARLGGDEFGILVAELGDPGQALVHAERVCRALREPFRLGDRQVTSTGSVGIAVSAPGEYDAEGLLRDADVAMYQAKHAGRDQVAVFDPQVRRGTSERFELAGDLRHAVATGEIEVVYQPIFDVGGGTVAGLEALARWERPTFGPVPPVTFIPLAEDLGLVAELGEQVLRSACTAVRQWRAETSLPLVVAVNISGIQLADPAFAATVARVLDDVGLPASALELEVTESVLMADVGVAGERLAELRDLGVSLAIDDFGTGYSSLAYLRDLPVNVLKIDRSFTAALPDDRPLVALVTDLARAIGATTVVEGVETRDQLRAVADLGCDQAQGFYLSKPLPRDAVSGYLGEAAGRARSRVS